MARSEMYFTKSHLLRRLHPKQPSPAGAVPAPRMPVATLRPVRTIPGSADIALRLDRHVERVQRSGAELEKGSDLLRRRSLAQHELREESIRHLLSECRALEELLSQTILRSREQHESIQRESAALTGVVQQSRQQVVAAFDQVKRDLALERITIEQAKSRAAAAAVRSKREHEEVSEGIPQLRHQLDLRNETFHNRSRQFEQALTGLKEQAGALLMEPADEQASRPRVTQPLLPRSVPEPAPPGFLTPLTPPSRQRTVPLALTGLGRRLAPSMYVGLTLLALFLATAFGVLLAAT